MDVNTIYALLSKDLAAVDQGIEDVLTSHQSELLADPIAYLLQNKGKRIRPVLVFLAAYLSQKKMGPNHYHKMVQAAVSIELIHMASLIHDDVIDDAAMRRGAPSFKSKFGNTTAVTYGVYLYSVAVSLVSQTGSVSFVQALSLAVKKMCEGELLQAQLAADRLFSEARYYEVLAGKTGALFELAAQATPLIVGSDKAQLDALTEYASHLGIAFQLTDDYLDVFGSDEELAKETGQDFIKGQLTLPMIIALKRLPSNTKEHVLKAMEAQDISGYQILKEQGVNSTLQEELYTVVLEKVNAAKLALLPFKKSEFKEALIYLVDYIFERIVKK